VPFLATSTQRYPDSTTTPVLTLGLGIRFGIATIDTRVEIGQWNGLLSGPVAAEGTLTLDFKALPKPASKQSARADVMATPQPEKKAEPVATPAPEAKPEEKASQASAATPTPQAKPEEKAAPEPAPAKPEKK
jgi:outer membrane biosynthesis protein TonB